MFPRNYWYVAATAEELDRKLLARSILGEPLVLFRTQSGKAIAMQNTCPHRSLPLSMGKLIGDEVQCGYHGLQFDATGNCTHIPGQVHIPQRTKVKVYPIVERWRWVWVWMGDPNEADAASIPDMHWNDDPAWAPTGGHLEIGCHFQLLVDNLLDLSHAAYVHAGTIGDKSVAETPATTSRNQNEVTLERRVTDVAPPPFFSSLHGYTGRINRMHRIVFTPPANIVILSRCVPSDHDLDTSNNALEYMVLNGITPAKEKSTHHFWAVNRNFAIDDQKMSKSFYDQSLKTFIEDVEILEAQQGRIDDLGGSPDWPNFGNDAAGVHARRIIAQLTAQ